MEMQAAIKALEALKEPCEVEVFTDSKYLMDGITSWLAGWKRKGWKTKSKKPLKSEDLWRALDAAVSRHKVQWRWLKGHAGHAGNERCDQPKRLGYYASRSSAERPFGGRSAFS